MCGCSLTIHPRKYETREHIMRKMMLVDGQTIRSLIREVAISKYTL
jgi:hypothetical protein